MISSTMDGKFITLTSREIEIKRKLSRNEYVTTAVRQSSSRRKISMLIRFTASFVKYAIDEIKKFWGYGSRPGQSEYMHLLINRLRECNVIE